MLKQWLPHLAILPILIPLISSALILFCTDKFNAVRIFLSLLSCMSLIIVSSILVLSAGGFIQLEGTHPALIYQLANWPAPFGIVLIVDRLSALMLLLGSVVALCALIYAFAKWERTGVFFLPLFQFLLVGVNGAFLTGDIFNLFVFFEILLAASYGLSLHGSGERRVKASLHYVAINLVASFFFLIAAAIIYRVAGTLNLADLSLRYGQLSVGDKSLLQVGIVLLSLVFLVKAAVWPVNFWLTPVYSAVVAPVAGIFALLTKVGIYALLRLVSVLPLLSIEGIWGTKLLFILGILTMLVAMIAIMAAQNLAQLACQNIILSSGLLMSCLAFDIKLIAESVLFYMLISVLASAAFMMLVELAERGRTSVSDFLAASYEALNIGGEIEGNAKDSSGIAIPAAMAFMGMCFVCCALLLTGMPPLSGFVAKLSIIRTILSMPSSLLFSQTAVWLLIAMIIVSGLFGLIAMSRIGVRVFWVSERKKLRLSLFEGGPILLLIITTLIMMVYAQPIMEYLQATTQDMLHYSDYLLANGRT